MEKSTGGFGPPVDFFGTKNGFLLKQWALMALRDQLANVQHLTLQEREALEEKALRSLKQNEQASSALFYYAGAMMFSGGLAATPPNRCHPL